MDWLRRICLSCLLLGVVVLGVLGDVAPVFALDENKQDFTYSDLSRQDFSGQNLVGSSLAAADAREADFTDADLSQTILTKGVFLRANMTGVNLSKSFADRVIFDGEIGRASCRERV